MLTVGSLFTGIYGIELGLERTGYFKTIWMVENDEFCRKVLRRHRPEIPLHGDIRTIDWGAMPRVDMLTGGFPCQDISCANPRGKGIEGSRSGLWKEYAKAIRILRPRYALIENVPAIVRKGLDVVLADLAEAGYDAEWFDLRASDFGALHKRERIFIVAHTEWFGRGGGAEVQPKTENTGEIQGRDIDAQTSIVTHANGNGLVGEGLPILSGRPRQDFAGDKDGSVADSHAKRTVDREFGEFADKGGKHALGDADEGVKKKIITDDWCERIQRLIEKKIQGKQGFSWCEDVRRVEDLSGRPDIPEPLFRGGRDGVSSRLYLSIVGKGKEHDSEKVAEIDGIRRKILFDMWINAKSPETPPRIQCGDVRDILPRVPQEHAHEARYLGERIAEDEVLCCMWSDICSSPFKKTHDLRSRMLERIREKERLQTMENSKWVDRIKALGNAVVPDCAEFIGEMIMEFDKKEANP